MQMLLFVPSKGRDVLHVNNSVFGHEKLPEQGDLNQTTRPPHLRRIHQILPQYTSPPIPQYLHPTRTSQ